MLKGFKPKGRSAAGRGEVWKGSPRRKECESRRSTPLAKGAALEKGLVKTAFDEEYRG